MEQTTPKIDPVLWMKENGYTLYIHEIQLIGKVAKHPVFIYDGHGVYYFFHFPASGFMVGEKGQTQEEIILTYIRTCGYIAHMSYEQYQERIGDSHMDMYLSCRKLGAGLVEFLGKEGFNSFIGVGG